MENFAPTPTGYGPVDRRRTRRRFSDKERVRYWAQLGATWGGVAGLLFGPASSLVPSFFLVGSSERPLAHVCAALQAALIYAGLGALLGALYHAYQRSKRAPAQSAPT